MNSSEIEEYRLREQEIQKKVREFCRDNRAELLLISSWGDGRCGHIAKVFCEELGMNEVFIRAKKYVKRQAASKSTRKRTLERFGHRCAWCGTENDLCVDHIVPFSKGGVNDDSNLQILCRSCNSSKGTKIIEAKECS